MDSEIKQKIKDLKNHWKSFVKNKNQSEIQKHNWRKNRNAYMRGIHSYFRRKDVDKEKTLGFLNTLLSKKNESLSINESLAIVEFLVILEHELVTVSKNNFVLTENVITEKFLTGVATNFFDFKLSLLETLSIPEGLNDFIGFLLRCTMSKNLSESLLSMCEYVDTAYNFQQLPNNAATGDVVNQVGSLEQGTLDPMALPTVYNFGDAEFTLDTLQVSIEDALKDEGVLSVNLELKNPQELYIDLGFSGDKFLSFRLFVDEGMRGLPRIECYAGNNKGKEELLPISFSANHKLVITTQSSVLFPYDFMRSCVRDYIGVGLNESFTLIKRLHVPKLFMENLFRKVIRNGQTDWVQLKNKKRRRKILTSAQKMALRKAQTKAHTSNADHERAMSLLKGDKTNLYSTPKVVSSDVAPVGN